ncbi:MAG TPA: hypothetical protein VN969_05045 [Streptosporangiaceae bacterium]|nr:hypothetical protein [Streptosporangiaceae bacterium]
MSKLAEIWGVHGGGVTACAGAVSAAVPNAQPATSVKVAPSLVSR